MARCIITGVGSLVLTLLVWKTVNVIVPEVAFTFHITCGFVTVVSLLATGSALYRLTHPIALVVSPKKQRELTRAPKSASKSPKSLGRINTPGACILPSSLQKQDTTWFHRN